MVLSSVNTNETANRVDPVTASVIRGALENIAIEMGYKLMRMSYSSIIRESEDFGAAIIDANGNQLCESIQSTPLQSGPLPGYVRGIMAQMEARGERPSNRATSFCTMIPTAGPVMVPTSALWCPCFIRTNWSDLPSPQPTISTSAP